MARDEHLGAVILDPEKAPLVSNSVAERNVGEVAHDGILGPGSVLGVLSGVESYAITVNQQRCAKVRNRNVKCLKCAEACTSGCISLVDGQLSVDPSKCVGCGTCATVCPTCALESRHPSDGELLQACLAARTGTAGERVVLACQPLRRNAPAALEGDAAPVVCLGRVDESLLAELAVRGVSDIQLACGNCEKCQQKHGMETAKLVADTANQLFKFWHSDTHVEVKQLADFDGEVACDPVASDQGGASASSQEGAMSKDEAQFTPVLDEHGHEVLPAFAFAKHEHADELQNGLLRVMKDGTLPHFLPDRRERLIDALAQMGEPSEGSLNTRLWGCVVIDGGKCTSCRMCAVFCPTGAIRKFDNEDGTFGVDHFPGDCVKCGSCRDICPSEAILLLDEVKPSYIVEGSVHHYTMRDPQIAMGGAQQILNTMRNRMAGTNLFDR